MLVQVVEEMARQAAHRGAVGDPRAGRERRRHRYRRRPGAGLQDGEPQPSLVHRAVPGRGHRRRWHLARRLHHGCAAHRDHGFAPLRRSRARQDPASGGRRSRRHRGLWQLRRHPHRRRRMHLRSELQRQQRGQRHGRGTGEDRPDPHRRGRGSGEPGRLCRLQDRARRHPRRDHGLGRVRLRKRRQASHGPGRRSVHREIAAGGVPGADGRRRHRRHSGYGRGRTYLDVLRDGLEGGARHRPRPRPRATPGNRHERLRDHAVRESGAHAHGYRQGPRGPRARGVRTMGARLRGHRRAQRHRAHDHRRGRRDGGRSADRAAGGGGSGCTIARAPRQPPSGGGVDMPPPGDIGAALLALMGSPDLCSKRWVWEQYESHGHGRHRGAPGRRRCRGARARHA